MIHKMSNGFLISSLSFSSLFFIFFSRFLDDGFGQHKLNVLSPEEKVKTNFGTKVTTTSINKRLRCYKILINIHRNYAGKYI